MIWQRWDELSDGLAKALESPDPDAYIASSGDPDLAEFFAWHNRCAHRAGPVCQGRIMKRVIEPVADDGTTRTLDYDPTETNIVCPWHGYEFSIRTGYHQGSSRFRLRRAEFTIREGEIYVRT